MTQMKTLLAQLCVLLLLTSQGYAEKPCNVSDCYDYLCRLNHCEIEVDEKEIDRSEKLLESGDLDVFALRNEYIRTEALCIALGEREMADALCNSDPAEAQPFMDEAYCLEFNWRHLDVCEFVPYDECLTKVHFKQS